MNARVLSFWRRGKGVATDARLLAAGGLALLLAVAATPAAGQPGSGAEMVSPQGNITLEVRNGKVIRLAEPAETVFVADPEIADVQAQSPTIVYLFGRRAGETTLFAVGENDDILLRSGVTVQHNLSGLRRAIRQLLPDSAIEVATVDGSIVMDGNVESPTQMQELRELAARFLGEKETLLNRVRVTSPTQVHLKVQVAEVSRAVVKAFGINWEALFETGNFAFAFASGRDLNNSGGFLRAPAPTGGATPGNVFGDFNDGSTNIRAAIDALAEENLVNILAEPNLTALSGETATFLAGGEFPIPISSGEEGEVEIEFKEFGISLAFTPTVLNAGRISLRVRPEVSELSEAGAITISGLTIPALSTRRAETTVELGSGQSFMIGGLLSTDIQNAVSKFPGLGDIPVLGTLFRSQRFRRDESELVILVTPYLVRPADEQRLARPTDGYEAPSDLERILEGRLHSARLQPGRDGPLGPEGQRLEGPAGFVLD